MKHLTTLSISAFLFLGLSGTVFAGNGSIGEEEYKNNCASCHGITGKGDGQF
ncbi:cytochrome c, partial [endosymbiont of Ridgeia piscesae]